MKLNVDNCKVIIAEGDITEFEGDAIVNAANSLMIMGGGVAGAIKRKGGKEIEEEARKKAPVPVGKAIATTGGKLKVRHVIHAPTMERPAMRIGRENAYLATKAALELVTEMGLKRVAFPALGAGVGGLSVKEVTEEMLRAIKEVCNDIEVWLVAYGESALKEMLEAIQQ
jgi:O-acetyl-ADP-ribose deacetylase (regulator of RNase III)